MVFAGGKSKASRRLCVKPAVQAPSASLSFSRSVLLVWLRKLFRLVSALLVMFACESFSVVCNLFLGVYIRIRMHEKLPSHLQSCLPSVLCDKHPSTSSLHHIRYDSVLLFLLVRPDTFLFPVTKTRVSSDGADESTKREEAGALRD